MTRLSYLVLFVTVFFINHCLVQAKVFNCNSTAPCGCSTNPANINARIYGGETAASHSWNWAVSLRVPNGNHFCGGSILSKYYILTAAHCVDEPIMSIIDITAAIGIDNLDDSIGQRILVSKIYVHERYNKRTHENDIAILSLKRAISFKNSYTNKLCLPPRAEFSSTNFPEVASDLVAIGWGNRESGSLSNSLQQVTVQAVDSAAAKCSNSIHNTRLQFCAAVNLGGKDTCQGDSGGPLMYYSEVYQQWVVAGITSYGVGCGYPTHAGVYTRANMYIDWINSIVGNDGVVVAGEDAPSTGIITNTFCIILMVVSVFNAFLLT